MVNDLLRHIVTVVTLTALIWVGLYLAIPDLTAPLLWAVGGALFLTRIKGGSGGDTGSSGGWDGDGGGDGGD